MSVLIFSEKIRRRRNITRAVCLLNFTNRILSFRIEKTTRNEETKNVLRDRNCGEGTEKKKKNSSLRNVIGTRTESRCYYRRVYIIIYYYGSVVSHISTITTVFVLSILIIRKISIDIVTRVAVKTRNNRRQCSNNNNRYLRGVGDCDARP